MSDRSSGVLCHVTSLPGPFGIGDLGPAAYQWIDQLAAAGQRWWQILPLGPCDGNSPYRSFSAFAGNPLLISPDLLVDDGLLARADLKAARLPDGKVNFVNVATNKTSLFAIAHQRFSQGRSQKLAGAFRRFTARESNWLNDFALFMAIREAHPNQSWTQWPKPLLRRRPKALENAEVEYAQTIDLQKFLQFIFFRQLDLLRTHARSAGVALIGDLPIFISPESADVWTHPKLFQLNRQLQPTAVSGVPPDMFAATGQRWGNPLYDWKQMAKDRFAWWKLRLASALKQADLVRIDHFRGFESYWRIPAAAPTARSGKWVKAPGVELFEALLKKDSKLPLLAEDLGVITPPVEALRDRFNFPGMRVLQFGFTEESGNPHTPHNFIRHCFAYTGTHDNNTTVGWYKTLSAAAKKRLSQYAPNLNWRRDPAWSLINLLSASPANHTIIPIQDLLRLGANSRMNTPGEIDGNWEWRLKSFADCAKPLAKLAEISRIYERYNRPK